MAIVTASPSIYKAPLYTQYVGSSNLTTTHTVDDDMKYIEIYLQAAGGSSPTLLRNVGTTTNTSLSGCGSAGNTLHLRYTREAFYNMFPNGVITVNSGMPGTPSNLDGGPTSASANTRLENSEGTRRLEAIAGVTSNRIQNSANQILMAAAISPSNNLFSTGTGISIIENKHGARGATTMAQRSPLPGYFYAPPGGSTALSPTGRGQWATATTSTSAANVSPSVIEGFGAGANGRIYGNTSITIRQGFRGGQAITKITEYFS